MPTVELPDGTEIEFPEGTDAATINKVSGETWAKIQSGGQQSAPPSRFAGKSLSDLKQYYQQRKAQGAAPEELASVSDEYVKKEHEEGGIGLAFDDTMRMLAKGVPVLGGGLEELSAKTSSLFGGDYDEALDYQRSRDRFTETNVPEAAIPLQVAGGIGGTLAGARALGVGGMGVNSSVPLLQRILTGAGIGVPVGAADAFTRGEGGAENRAEDSLIGGMFGGVTGALAPALGQGLSSAYQNVKNFLTPNASFRALGVSKPVGEELVDLMGGDASKKGLARIRAAGPEAMLADAGPNAQGIADAVVQKRGPGASFLGEAIEERAKKAAQTATGSIDTAMGKPQGVFSRVKDIRKSTEAAREAVYQKAYQGKIDYSTKPGATIKDLWSRVSPGVKTRANTLLREEGAELIKEGGLPTVRQIDYVTRALNDIAESQAETGKMGGLSHRGLSAVKLVSELRKATRTAVKDFGDALDTAADPISRVAAVKLGARALNGNVTRAELAERISTMTGPEREALKSGLRDQIDEVIAGVRGAASDSNMDARQLNEMVKQFTSKTSREKISLILDDPRKTMKFFREMGQAFKAAELRAAVAQNSKTATRTQAMGGIDERLQPGVVGTAMEGSPAAATRKAIQIATGATPRQQRLRNNAQWLELARLLSEKRGRGAEELLRKLIAASKSRAASSAAGKSIGTTGAGVVAGSNPLLVDSIN